MAQLAMQQAMEEITDCLARIDDKLDDVLRAQTNQVLARMDGVDLAVREAMKVREAVGRVSEVTWSKVQATSSTIFDTQAYALREPNALSEKLEQTKGVGDLAKATRDAQSEVHNGWPCWLDAFNFRMQTLCSNSSRRKPGDPSPIAAVPRRRASSRTARPVAGAGLGYLETEPVGTGVSG